MRRGRERLGINRYHKEGKHCMYMLDVLNNMYVNTCIWIVQ